MKSKLRTSIACRKPCLALYSSFNSADIGLNSIGEALAEDTILS
jgi:hypothetical protein